MWPFKRRPVEELDPPRGYFVVSYRGWRGGHTSVTLNAYDHSDAVRRVGNDTPWMFDVAVREAR